MGNKLRKLRDAVIPSNEDVGCEGSYRPVDTDNRLQAAERTCFPVDPHFPAPSSQTCCPAFYERQGEQELQQELHDESHAEPPQRPASQHQLPQEPESLRGAEVR